MVGRFKKFRKYKKTFRKNTRPFKKYSGIRTKAGKHIHYFKRTFKFTIAVTDEFTVVKEVAGTVNSFNLAQCPNYADFTALYDEYKICGISRKYIYDRNSADTGTVPLPRLITVNDWNDTTDPANENELLEYSNCKQVRLDRIVKRYFKPVPQTATGSSDVAKRWLPTTASTTKHYGIKEAIVCSSTADNGGVDIYTTFYIACRNPR